MHDRKTESNRSPGPSSGPHSGQGRTNAFGHHSHPKLCLSGDWLTEAGFPLGQRYEVDVERGRLVLRAV